MNEDKAREDRIDRYLFELQSSKTPEARRIAFDNMRSEIIQRSPEQVRQMEISKGLR